MFCINDSKADATDSNSPSMAHCCLVLTSCQNIAEYKAEHKELSGVLRKSQNQFPHPEYPLPSTKFKKLTASHSQPPLKIFVEVGMLLNIHEICRRTAAFWRRRPKCCVFPTTMNQQISPHRKNISVKHVSNTQPYDILVIYNAIK